MNERMNLEEVEAMAALVAEHWKREGRNPTEPECEAMVAIAREMVAGGHSLH